MSVHRLRGAAAIAGFAWLIGCGGATSASPGAAEPDEPPPSQTQPEPAAQATAADEASPQETGETSETSAEAAIEQALAGDHRSADNRARDTYRHPKETLLFFGLEPDMTVVELAPSSGWYSEVLAGALCPNGGQLKGAIPSLEGPAAKYGQAFLDRIEKDPEVFDCVEPVTFAPPEHPSLGPDDSADMVLTFRSTHGWVSRDRAEEVYQAAFRVLEPGGIFGVVQHRADEGADPEKSAKQGYVPEAYVIELATDAGFELVERSDINANPKDDHDHPKGVWTLPPTLRLGDQDRQTYLDIGESDRMTLKFKKPSA